MYNNNIPEALSTIAKYFHHRGWMYGTAGNLSARDNSQHMWITASGKSKGNMTSQDFLKLNIFSNEVIQRNHDSNKPSAETEIHQAIYQTFPEAQACFHVHSVDACLATHLHAATQAHLPLPNLEMIKGFDIWKQNPNVTLPVFNNHLDVSKIADDIRNQFSQLKPDISALMIRDHGITVWGDNIEQTYNRVEILEFILSFVARLPIDN